MTPFWIGLGIYLGGWALFVVVVALHEGGPFHTDDATFLTCVGIMWPFWAVIGIVAGLSLGILKFVRIAHKRS